LTKEAQLNRPKARFVFSMFQLPELLFAPSFYFLYAYMTQVYSTVTKYQIIKRKKKTQSTFRALCHHLLLVSPPASSFLFLSLLRPAGCPLTHWVFFLRSSSFSNPATIFKTVQMAFFLYVMPILFSPLVSFSPQNW
jgi:hypothetical protein